MEVPRTTTGLPPLLSPCRVAHAWYGAINLIWVKTALTVEEFAARHLVDLQDAAREIASSVESPTNRGSAR